VGGQERRSGWEVVAGALDAATRPLRRMWSSDDPLDDYGLVHLASVAGDALVTVALANTVFFSVPVGQAKLKVAAYLALTMAPLAVAGPLLVPLLDRGGYRRLICALAALGRGAAALVVAANPTSALFVGAFVILVLSKIHSITKNGLTAAYAPAGEGLVRANARLGRIAVVGALVAGAPGAAMVRLAGSPAGLRFAALAYAICVILTVRLPQPEPSAARPSRGEPPPAPAERRGRVPSLGPAAAGTATLRGASGFLILLLAFALRTGGEPRYWFGVLATAALVGGFVGDVAAPRLSARLAAERIVFASIFGAGAAALIALLAYHLWTLALFALLAGMATELGRLAFSSLMQRAASAGVQGRVFVRYEVTFQLAWVAGAFLPALLPISFRTGVALLAAYYLALGVVLVIRAPGRRAAA
jgi:hypothetical protein